MMTFSKKDKIKLLRCIGEIIKLEFSDNDKDIKPFLKFVDVELEMVLKGFNLTLKAMEAKARLLNN